MAAKAPKATAATRALLIGMDLEVFIFLTSRIYVMQGIADREPVGSDRAMTCPYGAGVPGLAHDAS
jgi:hypothetical protein